MITVPPAISPYLRYNVCESNNLGEGAVLGIDFGLKRVGLANCDAGRHVAVGAGWLEGLSGRALVLRIKAEADKRRARIIVIGCPRTGGRDVDKVRRGVSELTAGMESLDFKVVLVDESFTTATALKARKNAGGKSSKPKGWIDEAAAVLILQDYLATLRGEVGVKRDV